MASADVLEVVGVSDSLTAVEYLRIRKVISAYYSVALTDCGGGRRTTR